jgi:predicted N-acetyltransferase YhbS
MGKIFPLSDKPSCYEATIRLIEKSFHYKKPNSFEIDFAPLIDKSNHHNCYILVDENENVLAHIGTREREINLNGKKFSLTLLGGIAVDEARRGEGIFQTLFQDVLAEKRSDTTFFILWSDLEKLYNKFGFHLCGTQYEASSVKKVSPFTKTTLATLSTNEKEQIKSLYKKSFLKEYLSLERNEAEWTLLEKVTSSDLFLRKKNEVIHDYYFINKGQDLPDVIFEYGSSGDLDPLMKELTSYGKLWSGKEVQETENSQYQFFMSPGDLRQFSDFVFEFTEKKFKIVNINLMKQEVFFEFEEETLSLELPEFLRGVFGPSAFEEVNVPTLFISGLDSV